MHLGAEAKTSTRMLAKRGRPLAAAFKRRHDEVTVHPVPKCVFHKSEASQS
jgi:hypothetical protein